MTIPGSVLTPQAVLAEPLARVGGKAAALARLAAAGFPVPGFVVLGAEALAQYLADNGLPWPASVADAPAVRAAIAASAVPAPLLADWLAAFDAAGWDRVAVRSSGAEEDSAGATFAGQFASVLGVSRGELGAAVTECWASSLSVASLAYRVAKGIPLGAAPAFGVIVQRQVFARKAGVLFTRHPLAPEGKQSYLEANFGTGESVVGGLVTPDSATFDVVSGQVQVRVANKQRRTIVSLDSRGGRVVEMDEVDRYAAVVTEEEAKGLFQLGLAVEESAGAPQDIEWAIDDEGAWLLQARPVPAGRGA